MPWLVWYRIFKYAPMDSPTLTKKIKSGEIDTVIVAFPDVWGRLVGKRFTGKFFLESVAEHGTHCCNYLLTVNMEMDPQGGFKLASWDKGYGDFLMQPDQSTLRILPWQPATALVICDFAHHDGTAVAEAPRSVLRRQLERLAEANLTAYTASELEFFLFNQTYHDAFISGYRDPMPSSDYRIDYHTMQPTRDEPLMRQIRNQMEVARVPVESSKGEWGRGQHELNFVYDQPLPMADMHVVFKQGVKEIAAQHGRSVTFMPKPRTEEVGSSCHVHISLWRDAQNLFWDAKSRNGTSIFRHFLGGLMKYSPEFGLFFAPTVNSYKRYQAGSWAPTKMAWSHDNRTVGFRIVGERKSFRIENRMPGADTNPYLTFAAMIAAGLAGLDEKLECGDDYRGNAYVDSNLRSLPRSLRAAADLFNSSELARSAFGEEVVDFYAHTARLEAQAFDDSVTDWERMRYFERI